MQAEWFKIYVAVVIRHTWWLIYEGQQMAECRPPGSDAIGLLSTLKRHS